MPLPFAISVYVEDDDIWTGMPVPLVELNHSYVVYGGVPPDTEAASVIVCPSSYVVLAEDMVGVDRAGFTVMSDGPMLIVWPTLSVTAAQ